MQFAQRRHAICNFMLSFGCSQCVCVQRHAPVASVVAVSNQPDSSVPSPLRLIRQPNSVHRSDSCGQRTLHVSASGLHADDLKLLPRTLGGIRSAFQDAAQTAHRPYLTATDSVQDAVKATLPCSARAGSQSDFIIFEGLALGQSRLQREQALRDLGMH